MANSITNYTNYFSYKLYLTPLLPDAACLRWFSSSCSRLWMAAVSCTFSDLSADVSCARMAGCSVQHQQPLMYLTALALYQQWNQSRGSKKYIIHYTNMFIVRAWEQDQTENQSYLNDGSINGNIQLKWLRVSAQLPGCKMRICICSKIEIFVFLGKIPKKIKDKLHGHQARSTCSSYTKSEIYASCRSWKSCC